MELIVFFAIFVVQCALNYPITVRLVSQQALMLHFYCPITFLVRLHVQSGCMEITLTGCAILVMGHVSVANLFQLTVMSARLV